MQHAQERFGDGVFLHQGQLTEFALDILRQMRPDIYLMQFRTGLRAHDVARLVTPQTFVDPTTRILDATQAALARVRSDGCAKCGGHDILAADAAPEFVCTACGATFPTPSGDDILGDEISTPRTRDMLREHPPQRVVVTGLGVATSLGVDVGVNADRITAGHCGITTIQQYDSSAFRFRSAAKWTCATSPARMTILP